MWVLMKERARKKKLLALRSRVENLL